MSEKGKKDKKKSSSKDKDKKDDKKGTPKKSSAISDKKSTKSKKGESPSASRADLKSELESQPDITSKIGTQDGAQMQGQNQGFPPGFGGQPGGIPGYQGALGSSSNYGGLMGGQFGAMMNAEGKKHCFLHNQQLRYFCDSCEELICYDCTVMGPHNTQLHRISSMEEAFRSRFDLINRSIHHSVVPKRAQLIAQIVRLDHRIDEIKTVKSVIEKDIRNEYGAIMERLRSSEGVKMAVLQHDIAEVQKDITRIDEILMTMEEIASGNGQITPQQQQQLAPDILAFLHKYRQINENIEYAVTKQFKVEIDVYPNDLPRELAERRVLMEHYEEQRKLLKFKDDVIWKLSQELKKKYDYFQDEFDKETRHEMNEWARLVDRYAGELKKYELVCSFCGQHLADSNVNGECIENTIAIASGGRMGFTAPPTRQNLSATPQQVLAQPSDRSQVIYYTDEDPPAEAFGTKRHFFGKPSLKGYKQNPFRTQTAGLLKEEVILQNLEAAAVLKKIYEMDHHMKIDLDSKFRQFDPNNTGIIKKNDFINVIFENVRSIQASELMQFMNLFTTSFDDVVNYDDFLKVLYKFGDMPFQNPNAYMSQQNFNQDYSPQQDGFLRQSSQQPHQDQVSGNIEVMQNLRDALLHRLQPKQKEIVERIRGQLRDQNIEEVLRKFARDNKDHINEDELLIGISKMNANVYLADIKELVNLLKNGKEGSKISIAETVQLIAQ